MSRTRQDPLTAVAVVVPAHNEEMLLGACLESLQTAAQRITLPLVVVVSLDRCVDGSAAVARRFRSQLPLIVLDGAFGGVGAARDAGVRTAREHLSGHHRDMVWVSNTDADTVVPPEWLQRQCALADSGLDLLLGTVEPGPAQPRDDPARRLWFQQHTLGEGHHHIHGANLGIRLSQWEAAGGFGARCVHEDVELAARVREAHGRWLATDLVRVVTSARRHSRVAAGFAHYLRGLDAECASANGSHEVSTGDQVTR